MSLEKKIILAVIGLAILGVGIYFLVSPYERCLRAAGGYDDVQAMAICAQYLVGGGPR